MPLIEARGKGDDWRIAVHRPDRAESTHDSIGAADGASAVEWALHLSARYSDQPMSWQTRLVGMGGVAIIALLILTGALFTWTSYKAVKTPATLSVFDVGRPAAPPEPMSEVLPGPKQERKEKPFPAADQLKVEPPEIASDYPMPAAQAKPVLDPGPPTERTTAPASKPQPPAPHVSAEKPTWEGLVLGALNKVKRYPRGARARRQQGMSWIRFVMDREGKVLSVQLERSSGASDLDREALALPKRASPLPKPPDDKAGDTLELVVPVEFFIR